MSVHDFCLVLVIAKGVKSNIKTSVAVNHVEVDIASIPGAFAFTVLDQGPLSRDGDADKVCFVQGGLTQTHRVHIRRGW